MRVALSLMLVMLSVISAISQTGNSFQAGKVLLKNGETKAGLIAAQFQNNKALRFKSTENASESSFELNQIKEVRIGSQERYMLANIWPFKLACIFSIAARSGIR